MTRSDFSDAYEKGYNATVRFLVSTGVPAETARDVAQAGWARGWERRAQLLEPGKVVSWVNRISLNLFRNRLRRQRPTEEIGDYPCKAGVSATAIDVRRSLSECSEEDKSLLESYYLEGYTSQELGRRNHCSPGAIRVRVFRARRRFMDRLLRAEQRRMASQPQNA
jgi:RNA polymerase sigma factor (sigma-70 family)